MPIKPNNLPLPHQRLPIISFNLRNIASRLVQKSLASPYYNLNAATVATVTEKTFTTNVARDMVYLIFEDILYTDTDNAFTTFTLKIDNYPTFFSDTSLTQVRFGYGHVKYDEIGWLVPAKHTITYDFYNASGGNAKIQVESRGIQLNAERWEELQAKIYGTLDADLGLT